MKTSVQKIMDEAVAFSKTSEYEKHVKKFTADFDHNKKERMLGTCPEELRPIIIYSFKLSDDAGELISNALKSLGPTKAMARIIAGLKSKDIEESLKGIMPEAILKDTAKLFARSSILKDIFWHELRNGFNLFGANVGIREEWQVVTWEDKDQNEEEEEEESKYNIEKIMAKVPAGKTHD